jgi:TnpA family transposase
MHEVLWAAQGTPAQRITALRQMLPRDAELTDTSRAALVREALVGDSVRVTTLLNSVAMLDLHGPAADGVLAQVETLRELAQAKARALPDDFDASVADPAWQPLLRALDRARALAALKACALTSIGRGLKGGRLWLANSWRHRNREDQLIPATDWNQQRPAILRSLSLTADADQYLTRVLGRLPPCLQELEKAVASGDVTIDEAGRMHLPHMAALDADPDVDRTRRAMFDVIGQAQLSDVLVQIDARTGFSRLLLGRAAKTAQELVAMYGALLAHGTESDARGVVAMVSGLELAHLTAAMRSLEARGRLREANRAIVDFQQRFDVARLWGSGEKGSADSMSLDTSRHLYAARMEHRRRQLAVGLYTHMMDSYGLFYDQPIMLNTRQAAPAVQGVEWHNATQGEEGIRLSLLAVDTHGYTNTALAVAKLLGFDLCVWLRDLAERKLFLPASVTLPEGLERLTTGRVSLRKIRDGWDPLLRLVASIRRGWLSPKEALDRLGSAAAGDPAREAADSLGRLLRTIFLCDFLTQPAFRRELRTLLNRGESVHQLQRAVYHGRLDPQRGRRAKELATVSGAHALLTNAVIAWNTMRMQEVLDRWKASRQPVDEAWLRRMAFRPHQLSRHDELPRGRTR